MHKDVEQAFGILQAQFAIVKGPCRLWSEADMALIMKTCVILGHMTIEDERGEKSFNFEFNGAQNSRRIRHQSSAPYVDIGLYVIVNSIINSEMILLSTYGSKREKKMNTQTRR